MKKDTNLLYLMLSVIAFGLTGNAIVASMNTTSSYFRTVPFIAAKLQIPSSDGITLVG